MNTAQDRWTLGSAQASAWLQALGQAPLDEVILLPMEQKRGTSARRERRRPDHQADLHAWPNPSSGPVYVLCNVPASVEHASLRILDLNGRLVRELDLIAGMGIAELQPDFAAPGIYVAVLRLDGIRTGQVKLALQ